MIEQAQILTTHNLATLISAGVQVDAERAAARCREARTTKPWVPARIDRQRVFFESLTRRSRPDSRAGRASTASRTSGPRARSRARRSRTASTIARERTEEVARDRHQPHQRR